MFLIFLSEPTKKPRLSKFTEIQFLQIIFLIWPFRACIFFRSTFLNLGKTRISRWLGRENEETCESEKNLSERIKCLIFDSEMCTVQKVGGEDRSESVLNAIQIHLQGWGWGLSKKQTVVGVVRVVTIQIQLQGWGSL